MSKKNIGLITYHYPHLKTEQVLQRLLNHRSGHKFKIFALPFKLREPRQTLIQHRPNQSRAIHPKMIADKHRIPYVMCSNDRDIDDSCEIYLVLGAGILSAGCVEDKMIINCHPGIIPVCRGLDSFKWAIYHEKPLGVTLHYLDARVDAGEIISVIPTNIYKSDSIETLARRHYESEIEVLSRFIDYLEFPENPYQNVDEDKPTKRMPIAEEEKLISRFSIYTRKYGIIDHR